MSIASPKFVLTGPESSGKTTLAQSLAQQLKTTWVPEFARPFLTHLGRPYVQADLLSIAAGQAAWENWYAALATAPSPLICDTDWTVVHIWDRYRFAEKPTLPLPRSTHPPAAYFLCAPDVPWAPDPLREHPLEREVLFGWYEHLLQQVGVPYFILQGDVQERLAFALQMIRGFY